MARAVDEQTQPGVPAKISDKRRRQDVANDESIYREVDQELAEDRLWNNIRRRGPLLAVVAVAIVGAVGASQFINAQKNAAGAQAARAYDALNQTLEESPDDAVPALELFIESAPDGYAALGRFRLAAQLARDGEKDRALAQYRSIYGDDSLPGRFRDLARIRAAHISIDESRDAVIADIGDLENAETPLGPYAREILGVAALSAGDYETAHALFQRLLITPSAPAPLRARAEEFAALAASAKAGVDISWNISETGPSIEDLQDALAPAAPVVNEPAGDDPLGEEHGPDDGHDHSGADEETEGEE